MNPSRASSNYVRVAFTQWFAANLRFPYTDAPVLSAYCSAFPTDEQLTSLGLNPVASGGTVWIIVPRDEGVFRCVQEVQGLPLVTDVQIYLDLLQVGLRGPEQAEALRAWDGFCR